MVTTGGPVEPKFQESYVSHSLILSATFSMIVCHIVT